MELVHDFTVPVPADAAWAVLTDVERVVPCLPGASLSSVDGDAFTGGMTVKLGPIGLTFKGQGAFTEKDPTAKVAVIEARGKDAKGNGGAHAVVRAGLTGSNGTTAVHVVTDLSVSGKAAQFSTGVMKDVSNRLLAQFADNLATQLSVEGRSDAPSAASAPPPQPPGTAPAPPADAGLDVGALLLGSPSVRQALRSVGFALAGVAFGYLWGKNRVLERELRARS